MGDHPLGDVTKADNATIAMVSQSQAKIKCQQQTGMTFSKFEAVEYRVDLNLPTVFFIKINGGDSVFVHIRINAPTDGRTPVYQGCKTDQTENSPITYFNTNYP